MRANDENCSPVVLESQTCFMCQHDTDDEIGICSTRTSTRSRTRNMQDPHNLCMECLPAYFASGRVDCSICRQPVDWDIVFRIPAEHRPAVREAIAEGEQASAVDHNTAFTEQVLQAELMQDSESDRQANIASTGYIPLENGMNMPIHDDGQFWLPTDSLEDRMWAWNPENIPKNKRILWNTLQRNTQGHWFEFNNLYFLALSGYAQSFQDLFGTIYSVEWNFSDSVNTATLLEYFLPRLLCDVLQVSQDLPWIDNAGRRQITQYLLKHERVPFHVEICDGQTTIDMMTLRPCMPLYEILELCSTQRQALVTRQSWVGQQRHIVEYLSATGDTFLHLLMKRRPWPSILGTPLMDAYMQRDDEYMTTALSEIDYVLQDQASIQQHVNSLNYAGRSALSMVVNFDTNITGVEARSDETASLNEWRLKANKIDRFLKHNMLWKVNASNELRAFMDLTMSIMTHCREPLVMRTPYNTAHYTEILSLLVAPIRTLIAACFRFWHDGENEQDIDSRDIFKHMVCMQDLKTVRKFISRGKIIDIDVETYDNETGFSALDLVDFFPLDIVNPERSSKIELVHLLTSHGATYGSNISNNY